MSKTNPKVDGYLRKHTQWDAEMRELRRIILESELTEDVKWRVPCYTFETKNVIFFGPYKDSAVMSFVKGVLLKDPKKLLIQQTENSQSVRIIKFTSVEQIRKLEPTLKAYIDEAIGFEKSGAKVPMKNITEHKVPEELQTILDANAALKKAFSALTPGRQRGYMLYVGGAKQSKTRTARAEKYVPHILAGKGMDDE